MSDVGKKVAVRNRQEQIALQMVAIYAAKMTDASQPEEREQARRNADEWTELADEARLGRTELERRYPDEVSQEPAFGDAQAETPTAEAEHAPDDVSALRALIVLESELAA
ncbi:MAG TPA: hypothetical protein VLW50_29310 [Streptosporangiaceae bacterium]|nr:hypothetical protein [Streptosporangiaceae bacterium]